MKGSIDSRNKVVKMEGESTEAARLISEIVIKSGLAKNARARLGER